MKTAEEIWNEFDMMVKFYHSDPESVISRKDKFINLVESFAKEHAIEFLRAMSGENPHQEADENAYDIWINQTIDR